MQFDNSLDDIDPSVFVIEAMKVEKKIFKWLLSDDIIKNNIVNCFFSQVLDFFSFHYLNLTFK